MAGLRGRALIAHLLVCTVWGSTYLAIRVGVMHLPPMLFAGIRFVIAGLLLAGIVLATGDRLPRSLRERTSRTSRAHPRARVVGARRRVLQAEPDRYLALRRIGEAVAQRSGGAPRSREADA